MKTPLLLKHFWIFLVFLAFAGACDHDESYNRDSGAAYFPLETGLYQIFSVRELQYSGLPEPALSEYELMVEVVDSFPSGAHEYTFVIHRSKRASASDAWRALDTWSVRKDERQVIVSEGNTPFVKMKFPVAGGTRWNGNTFNTLPDDEYETQVAGQITELNGMTFENTLIIEQEHNDDVIVFHDVRREIYARDVGLVYKEIIQLNYCTADHCLGQQKVDHGMELKMEIKSYGKH